MIYRELSREEIARIAEIDRSEIVNAVWKMEKGQLALVPEYWNIAGWPSGPEQRIRSLEALYDRGGKVFGAFDEGSFAGTAAVDTVFFGKSARYLELCFMHVSAPYRNQGIGKKLIQLCAEQARAWGAEKLYVSGAPSENTFRFYTCMGCVPVQELDPERYKKEPEDIHLELVL